MVNSKNNNKDNTDPSTEERLDSMEQALLKVMEQIQALTQSTDQLRAPPPPQKGCSGTQEGIGSQPIEVNEIQLEPNLTELKKELEAQAKEIKKKLFEKMKT